MIYDANPTSSSPNPKLFIWAEYWYFTNMFSVSFKHSIKMDLMVWQTAVREGLLYWIIFFIESRDSSLHEVHGQQSLISLVFSYKGTKGLRWTTKSSQSKLEGIYFGRLNEADTLPAAFLLLHKTEVARHWGRPHLTFDLVLWPYLRFFVPADQYVICRWPRWVPNQDEQGIYGFLF